MRHLTGEEMVEIEKAWANEVALVADAQRRGRDDGRDLQAARKFVLAVAFSQGNTLAEIQYQMHTDPEFVARVHHAISMLHLLDNAERTWNEMRSRKNRDEYAKAVMEQFVYDVRNQIEEEDHERAGPTNAPSSEKRE